MWDKAFTVSLTAYGISSALFLAGHFLLPVPFPEESPIPQMVTFVGAALLGIAGLSMGVTGIGMLIMLLFRAKAQP